MYYALIDLAERSGPIYGVVRGTYESWEDAYRAKWSTYARRPYIARVGRYLFPGELYTRDKAGIKNETPRARLEDKATIRTHQG
jgi:hypothetical protein